METMRQVPRPRVSREARLLVTTAIVSMVALGALARIRYGSLPAEQRPLPAMITSLVASADFERMAEKVDAATARARASLVAADLVRPSAPRDDTPARVTQAVLRLRDDLGVMLIEQGWTLTPDARVVAVARDDASGLTVVRFVDGTQFSAVQPRLFERPQRPRYVMVSETSSAGATLRPLFVGALLSVDAPLWGDAVWTTPSGLSCQPGAFVFTADGDWVGLAASRAGQIALVPGDVVIREAERLVKAGPRAPGTLGVQVQWVTPAIARATGASQGVAIAWVDPAGPSARHLRVGDVVEAVSGRRLASFDEWTRHAGQLTAGTSVDVRVRRSGQPVDVSVTPSPIEAAPTRDGGDKPESGPKLPLGLTLKARSGIGSDVTSVQPSSLAAKMGLRVGDVITSLGSAVAPTPLQVKRALNELAPGASLLVGVRRDGDYRLLVADR